MKVICGGGSGVWLGVSSRVVRCEGSVSWVVRVMGVDMSVVVLRMMGDETREYEGDEGGEVRACRG